MSRSKNFIRSSGPGAVFIRWWERISAPDARGTARADRAVLERASTLTHVALTPAYQRLYADLQAAQIDEHWKPYEQDRIAAFVGLAAHLKHTSELSLPRAMSQRTDPTDRNPVSDLRFSRLLDAPDIDALFIGLRRLLPLIDHTADPMSLANDVFHWGDAVKKRWAYDFNWKAGD